jgi:hypothetical protein
MHYGLTWPSSRTACFITLLLKTSLVWVIGVHATFILLVILFKRPDKMLAAVIFVVASIYLISFIARVGLIMYASPISDLLGHFDDLLLNRATYRLSFVAHRWLHDKARLLVLD